MRRRSLPQKTDQLHQRGAGEKLARSWGRVCVATFAGQVRECWGERNSVRRGQKRWEEGHSFCRVGVPHNGVALDTIACVALAGPRRTKKEQERPPWSMLYAVPRVIKKAADAPPGSQISRSNRKEER